MTVDFRRWAPSLTMFARWLPTQSQVAAKLWARRLNSGDTDKVEAAIAEAVAWDYVTCRADSVHLGEEAGIGGIDFEFVARDQTFLVEVTNISTRIATSECGMSDTERFSGFYALLTERIRTKVRSKFSQAKRQMDHPLLVAVTTLHWNASAVCVNRHAVEFAMGSPPKITWDLDSRTGDPLSDVYQSTDLTQSVFLSPNPILDSEGEPIARAKFEPISGFLVCSFGLVGKDARAYGGLNPIAAHPFDVSLLPDIPFCWFKEWPIRKSIAFDWTVSEEEERNARILAARRRLQQTGFGRLLETNEQN